MKKILPIGFDDFAEIRKGSYYYVDKTLLIKDFIEFKEKVTLITRPRRFGKTLNIMMLRDFFDITKDSKSLFDGLNIMNTVYSEQINSRPVIFFTFKNCRGDTVEGLRLSLIRQLIGEYLRYYKELSRNIDESDSYVKMFLNNLHDLENKTSDMDHLRTYLCDLIQVVHDYYNERPILLIDEYDQPILSSYENGYHKDIKNFFSDFYGLALKGNEYLSQALLTGIQRIAKESIFSQLNHIKVYTVVDRRYSAYFGLTKEETKTLLEEYDLELNEQVKLDYDGYKIGDYEMYNPWSILYYADTGILDNYWINTSTNYLIKEALQTADTFFMEKFDILIQTNRVEVGVNLQLSFIELHENSALWGLLVNSGYITVEDRIDREYMVVRIPNDEVKHEFQKIIAEKAHISNENMKQMFRSLMKQDMDHFLKIYEKIVMSCTSYFDAKENAYHMLFLGMCISLRNLYTITSNLESGYGRYDICMESLSKSNMHIVIEFKQGEDIEQLKKEALEQIIEQKYYSGLSGKVLCIGIAHNKKKCAMLHKIVDNV